MIYIHIYIYKHTSKYQGAIAATLVFAAPLSILVVAYASNYALYLIRSLEQTIQIHMVTCYRCLFSVERDRAASNFKVTIF